MAHQKTNHIFTKIAFKPLRTNLFHIVFLGIFLTIGLGEVYAQDINKKTTAISPASSIKNPKTNPEKSLESATDSKSSLVKKDSTTKKQAFLDGKVKYKAKDYTKIDQKKNNLHLKKVKNTKFFDCRHCD